MNGRAYVAAPEGDVYTYAPASDRWDYTGFSVGRCDALYPMGNDLCAADNSIGIVTRYSTSGARIEELRYTANGYIQALAETDSRTWLLAGNTLYLHDSQGLTEKTTLPTNGLVAASEGLLYYFAAEGVVNSYDPASHAHARVPIFLYTAGGPGVETFHSGLPLVADGVTYLLNSGYNRYGDLTWSGAQRKNILRIDMRQSYRVTVR